MNYYNPYFFNNPYSNMTTSNLAQPGLFRSLFRRGTTNFSFSNLLNGAQKTLNVANQGINLVRQVHPIINNAKTMFKVMNEFKKVDTPQKSNPQPVTQTNETPNKTDNFSTNSSSGPTFFQ